jgi:hypothetical protein
MTILDSSRVSHDETPRCQFEEADQEDGSQSAFKVLLGILWKGRPPKTLTVQESCFLTYIWLNCSVGGFMLINIITGSAPTAYEMQQKLRTKILLYNRSPEILIQFLCAYVNPTIWS